MDFLVGSTGFVGSNLAAQHRFDGAFHSSDIAEAYGKAPDLLVYAGVPAEMFLANRDPQADRRRIEGAMENIRAIAPRCCVLVSSIAVYADSRGADEDTVIDPSALSAYGLNRLALEQWVEEHVPDSLILHLPAIYGRGLKKNFLYDMIHVIPAMLTEAKLSELSEAAPVLREYYLPQNNGFTKCKALDRKEEAALKALFLRLDFSALHFTDSRSVYQFYALKDLWGHIELARANGLRRLNLATPPLSAAEVYRSLTGKVFTNELAKQPFDYDMRSRYAALFGGKDGYLISREKELQDIRDFVRAEGGAVL